MKIITKGSVFALPLFCLFIVIIAVSCSSVIDKLESDMLVIPTGDFEMGCDSIIADADEYPVHLVHVDSFKLCRYEVSQELWKSVMKKNPSYQKGKRLPIEAVSYYDVEKFLEELNKITGRKYRLPTEIEWEYAAYLGTQNMNIDDIAWYDTNSDGISHIVGIKQADALGLFDILGNVNEWVSDFYDGKNYSGEQVISIDTLIVEAVFRGGAFNADLKYCRTSNRNHVRADMRNYAIGLRIAESCVN